LRDDRIRAFLISIVIDDHTRALLGKTQGNGGTNAFGRTSDNDGFAGQIGIHKNSFGN
jgi:hypothetical protein